MNLGVSMTLTGDRSPIAESAGPTTDAIFLQLRQVTALATLVDSGTVTSAAKALNKSPSALVRGIAELEGILGVTLLERRRGYISPTLYGDSLLSRATRIEREIAAAQAELSKSPGSSVSAIKHLLQSGRKLRLLVQLSDAGSVSGAASALSISQPGASLSLARIEEAIGLSLFHRNIHGVVPTDVGARLVRHAKLIRAELRHALAEISALSGAPSGTIVIGTLPMARANILPRAIAASLEVFPELRVQVVEAQREPLLAQLRSGEIDALLSARAANFDPRGLIVESLFKDRLVVVASRDHPLAGASSVSLNEIAPRNWIMPWENAIARILFEEQFAKRGLNLPKATVQTGDLLVMRPLLARADLLAFTSSSLVRFEIDSGALVELPVDMDELTREIVLLSREGASLPASTCAFIEELRKASAFLPTR